MSSFALLFACLLLGAVLRKSGRLPASTPAALNGFIIFISLPAVTFLSLHEIPFSRAMLYPISMAWILFVTGAGVFVFVGKALGWDKGVIGAVLLTCGLGNTSFVGFPLLEALFGPHALKTGVLADQPGSFLVLCTLGIIAASICSARSFGFREILAKAFSFPPLYTMALAVLLRLWHYPAWLASVFQRLADTMIPLALVSVGYQTRFRLTHFKGFSQPLIWGLVYKLLIGPAAIALLFVGLMGARGEAIQITIAEAAMAPMITGAIVAAEYGLAPELATLLVGVGIPVSLLTVPVWVHFLRWV